MTFRLWVIAATMAMPATAMAQRVEDGRLGDASLRIGSGGYNLPLRGPVPNYGNQIMEGNITRGRQFRGFSPISSTTDFGSNLPSSSLDNFRRDSVGVDDIRAGYSSYTARPWYSPTQTVPTAGSLSIGFRPSGLPPLPQSYVNLPPDQLGSPFGGPRSMSSQVLIAPRSDLPRMVPENQTDVSYYGDRTTAISRSALFGIAPDPSKGNIPLRVEPNLPYGPSGLRMSETRILTGIAGPGEQIQRPGENRELETLAPPGSALDRLVNPSGYQAGTTGGQQGYQAGGPGILPEIPDQRPKPFGTEATSQPWQRYAAQGYPGVGQQGAPAGPLERTAQGRFGQPGLLPFEQGDVYRKLYRAASLTEQYPSITGAETGAKGEKTQEKAAAAPVRGEAAKVLQEPAAPRPPLLEQQREQMQKVLTEPIVTFVGTDKTLANKSFAEAEKRLAAGQYYEAVNSYDVARTADPENALIWIGRGNALLGAGDYLSAYASLEEGFSRFPQIARFSVDLRKFLSYKDVIDVRRADLERRLEEGENFKLRFLLGYIEYYSGLAKFGLANLEKAAKGAPTTSIISKLPAMLQK
jgi:hypothetical protein